MNEKIIFAGSLTNQLPAKISKVQLNKFRIHIL